VRLGDVWALHEEDAMQVKAALSLSGPVNVGLSAENDRWYDYQGGVVDWADCDPEHVDHAVLGVGWGTDSSFGDYLLVKNSWGADWGEQGYFRISLSQKYSRKGICGVLTDFTQACVGSKCDV
jgi:cathepsin L